MAAVGDLDASLFYGIIPELKPVDDEWHVPGQDGDGIAVLGSTGPVFEVHTVAFIEDEGDADSYITDAQDSQTTLVDVTDAFGATSANVYVKSVDVLRGNGGQGAKKAVLGASGPLFRIELFWQLKVTE